MIEELQRLLSARFPDWEVTVCKHPHRFAFAAERTFPLPIIRQGVTTAGPPLTLEKAVAILADGLAAQA